MGHLQGPAVLPQESASGGRDRILPTPMQSTTSGGKPLIPQAVGLLQLRVLCRLQLRESLKPTDGFHELTDNSYHRYAGFYLIFFEKQAPSARIFISNGKN